MPFSAQLGRSILWFAGRGGAAAPCKYGARCRKLISSHIMEQADAGAAMTKNTAAPALCQDLRK